MVIQKIMATIQSALCIVLTTLACVAVYRVVQCVNSTNALVLNVPGLVHEEMRLTRELADRHAGEALNRADRRANEAIRIVNMAATDAGHIMNNVQDILEVVHGNVQRGHSPAGALVIGRGHPGETDPVVVETMQRGVVDVLQRIPLLGRWIPNA